MIDSASFVVLRKIGVVDLFKHQLPELSWDECDLASIFLDLEIKLHLELGIPNQGWLATPLQCHYLASFFFFE